MIQHSSSKPAMQKHDERFDAAWRYRYGVAALRYTEHWLTCQWCSEICLCPDGEMLNALCLDIENEMVETDVQQQEAERKSA